jgi:dephospho-CoA kinase
LLEAYNNIIHPAVAEDTLIFSSKYLDKPYILKEAALLVETGSYLTLDKLIVVTSSLQERINRVIQRDNVTEKEVLVRIKNQLPEEEKLKVADYIIVNDGNSSLIEQVKAIHQELLLMAY